MAFRKTSICWPHQIRGFLAPLPPPSLQKVARPSCSRCQTWSVPSVTTEATSHLTATTQNLYLNSVTAILLLDADSNRLLAKYYQPAHQDPKGAPQFKHPFQTLKEQRAFENGIFEKTRRATGASHCPSYSVSCD